jgi:chemotaxis regulatin CheY-phosphate phosphatase CheZ
MLPQTSMLQQAIGETEDRLKRDEKMLRSLHQILQELMPLVDRIRVDLKDSTSRMPDVSKQLSSVTTATETATVEILNVLEDLTATIARADASLAVLKKIDEARTTVISSIASLPEPSQDSELRAIWSQCVTIETGTRHMALIEEALTQTREQSLNIAMALQVQDITSQQIAGATHLIEQVEAQLQTALHHFETPGTQVAERESVTTVKPQLTFDSGATYTKGDNRQAEADEITKQFVWK